MDHFSPDLLNAFVGLWKPILALAVLVFVLRQHDSLGKLLSRLVRFRKGDTEMEFSPEPSYSEIDSGMESGLPKEDEQASLVTDNAQDRDHNELLEQMFAAFAKKDFKAAEEAYLALIAKESDRIKKWRYEAIYHFLHCRNKGDMDSLQELIRLSEMPEMKVLALELAEDCYRQMGELEKIKKTYEQALEGEISDKDKAAIYAALAKVLYDLGDKTQAFDYLWGALGEIPPSEGHAILYRAIAVLFKREQNALMQSIALEKALEFQPEDNSLLFEAAFAQSEANLSPLSILNYELLLNRDAEQSMAANNLGAELQKLDLPIHAVRLFRKASEQGNSLAMANLAFKYIKEGFVEEAKHILEKALSQGDTPTTEVHPNVYEALSTLTQKEEKETDRLVETRNSGEKLRRFLRRFVEAQIPQEESGESRREMFVGEWWEGKEKVVVEVENRHFIAEWKRQGRRKRIRGTIINLAAYVSVETWQSWRVADKDMGYFSGKREGLAFVDKEKGHLYLCILGKEDMEFITFSRSRSST